MANIKRKGIKLRKTAFERDSVLGSSTYKLAMSCGNVYVTLSRDEDDDPVELFIKIGKAGMCQSCQAEVVGRVISIALQGNRATAKRLAKTLRGVQCGGAQVGKMDDPKRILSCADGIARILAGGFLEREIQAKRVPIVGVSMGVGVCPDCGGTLVAAENCVKCLDPGCGYSKC